MNQESQTLIFVYGTLKRGFCRSQFLENQIFLTKATTAPHYTMYDCGEYPGLVVDLAEGISIQGELWSVDESRVQLLDKVEGVSENWFSRDQIELISTPNNQRVQAYYFQGDVTRLKKYGCNWTKGQ